MTHTAGVLVPVADPLFTPCRRSVRGSRIHLDHVADTNDAWSDWFHDVDPTWDHTWVITDLRNALATLASTSSSRSGSMSSRDVLEECPMCTTVSRKVAWTRTG